VFVVSVLIDRSVSDEARKIGPTKRQSSGPPPATARPCAPLTHAQAGRHAPLREIPRRRRARGGTPRGQPDSGAAGCRRPSQRLLLRAAVPVGHRTDAPPVQQWPAASSGPSSCRKVIYPGQGSAAHAGFSDQTVFCRHFKRLVGVTPGQFRTPARIAQPAASPAKKPQGAPPYHSQ
jgi:AraC-like DNA-binding protein